MATQNIDSLVGGAGGQDALPRNLSHDIWQDALEQAVVPRLAKSHPVILGENTIPTLTKRPAASIIGEGENKKQSDLQIGSKSFRPIKAVVGLEFTMEAVETNPVNVLEQLAAEASGALARQIDLAVIHGRQASDGAQLSGQEYITQNAIEIEIPEPEKVDQAVWEGYSLISESDNSFNGFAADPRFSAFVGNARDEQGRRMYPEIGMGGSGLSTFNGLPVAVAKTVSGRVDASKDTGIMAIGGDWDAVRFGRALDIPLRRIEYGDPLGNGDLQRRNSIAFIAEIMFGWAIMDDTAFVTYMKPAAPGGSTGGDTPLGR